MPNRAIRRFSSKSWLVGKRSSQPPRARSSSCGTRRGRRCRSGRCRRRGDTATSPCPTGCSGHGRCRAVSRRRSRATATCAPPTTTTSARDCEHLDTRAHVVGRDRASARRLGTRSRRRLRPDPTFRFDGVLATGLARITARAWPSSTPSRLPRRCRSLESPSTTIDLDAINGGSPDRVRHAGKPRYHAPRCARE